MGQSIGTLNIDNVVDQLIADGYIHTMNTEKVFRCVDLSSYYPYGLRCPRMYALALERLELHKGLRFLNIGFGLGYFNTMAGLLLGKFIYL